MAVLLVGGSVSLFAADVQITEPSQQLTIQDVNTNYYFTADGQILYHDRGGPRHVTGSVYFYADNYNVTICSKEDVTSYVNDNSNNAKNTLGWDGVNFVGNTGSSITLSLSENVNPVWITSKGINILGGTTLNLNYGEKISQYVSNSRITIADGSTVVQNTRRVADSTTLFQFVGGTGDISTGGNVLFTQESLTAGTSKGSAIVNTSLGSGITAKFDSSFASGSAINFVTDISGAEYSNTFALDGQNINIYAKDVSLSGLTIKNSASTKSQVYVESNSITLANRQNIDANTSIYLKGVIKGVLDMRGQGEKTIELTGDSTITMGDGSGSLINLKSAGETRYTLSSNSRMNIAIGFDMQNVKILTKNAAAGTGGNNALALKMDSKSEFETYGGLRIQGNSDIAGSIIVKGTGRSSNSDGDDFMLAISGSGSNNAIVRSTAIITQKYDPSVTSITKSKNWISIGSLTIEDGAKLQFEDKIHIYSSKIILEGNDAFNVGLDGENFNSQAKSTINISNHMASQASQATTEFVINAANELGSFEFSQDNHLLAISFGKDGSLTIGEDAGLVSFVGDFFGEGAVLIKGDVFNKLRVYDLDFDSNEGLKSRFMAEGDRVITFVNNGDGSYFINTVVPEPAEWAAIMGVCALTLVYIRRRK